MPRPSVQSAAPHRFLVTSAIGVGLRGAVTRTACQETTMRRSLITLVPGLFLVAAVLSQPAARGQIDPTERALEIFQNGIKVGEVYREADTDPPQPDRYLEHWVLFDT